MVLARVCKANVHGTLTRGCCGRMMVRDLGDEPETSIGPLAEGWWASGGCPPPHRSTSGRKGAPGMAQKGRQVSALARAVADGAIEGAVGGAVGALVGTLLYPGLGTFTGAAVVAVAGKRIGAARRRAKH